jgi:hypothetical protein
MAEAISITPINREFVPNYRVARREGREKLDHLIMKPKAPLKATMRPTIWITTRYI